MTPKGGADRIDAVEPEPGGAHVVRVRVRAAPADGAANAAVIRLIARALDLPRSAVRISRGETARIKLLEIDGLDETEALTRLSG